MTATTNVTSCDTLPATGERFECQQCGMEIEIITECTCDSGNPHFICCGQPLVCSGKSALAATREAFVEQTRTGLNKTQETVAWLKEEASKATDATKAEISRDAETLSRQFEEVRKSLGKVQDASGDAWKDLAKGCSESWKRFKAACEKAAERYQ